jgi:signal transduction histidine kinase
MLSALRILLIEDNPADARLTYELLREAAGAAFEPVHADTLDAGLALLAKQEFAVVLLDLSLPDAQGIDTVCRVREAYPRSPLVVLSGLDDEETAVKALKNGAHDYLVKGRGDGEMIARAIRYAIERKRGELQLTEAKEAAEAANSAKSTFLAHMSHELRTPLNAVIGFSDLIARGILGPGSEDVYRQYGRYINDSGRHLLELVNEILDLSKLLADRLVLCEEQIDLQSLLRNCVTLVSTQAAQKEITISLKVSRDMPPLIADELRLKQVLLNVLSNAVKFSGTGTVVEISDARGDEGDLVIAVRDQGVGMRPEDIPIALEPFQQVESCATAQEGTGLGLPIAKLIVEKHGGKLNIISAVGVGTTVCLSLPSWRLSATDDEALLQSA